MRSRRLNYRLSSEAVFPAQLEDRKAAVRWLRAHADEFGSKRLTIGTVDGVAGFRRLVADSPSAGGKFVDSIDRKIGQAWEHRAEVGAER